MLSEDLANVAEAGDDVDDAIREASGLGETGRKGASEGRLLGRFKDDRVACCDGRSDLARELQRPRSAALLPTRSLDDLP